MSLRWLADGAAQSRIRDPDDIRSRLRHIEEDVTYYRAYLYVKSEPVADAYQRFTEALYDDCMPIITAALAVNDLASNTERQQHPLCEELRRNYLVEVRRLRRSTVSCELYDWSSLLESHPNGFESSSTGCATRSTARVAAHAAVAYGAKGVHC